MWFHGVPEYYNIPLLDIDSISMHKLSLAKINICHGKSLVNFLYKAFKDIVKYKFILQNIKTIMQTASKSNPEFKLNPKELDQFLLKNPVAGRNK